MPALLNEQIDDQLLFERQESFAGGEDNYRRSTLLDADQCSKLVNIIVRDNYEAWTRPGADLFAPALNVAGLLADDGTPLVSDAGTPLQADDAGSSSGPIQALSYYDTPNNKFVLSVCNGYLQACPGFNQPWQTPTPVYTAPPDVLVEIEQGVDTCLITDGQSPLAILNQTTITTCGTGVNDPPTGANILCFHAGRMWAAGFAGSVSGKERDAICASNLLSFGNGQWDLTARSFRVGGGEGDPITALMSMHGSNLAVFKSNSIWIVDTNPANPIVGNYSANDMGKALGFSVGCVGKRAVCAVENDLFFMAQDGVRSLQRMQAAAGQWQLSDPVSTPIQQYIDRINKAAQSAIRACSYREFVFFAVPLDGSMTNNHCLVYNTRLNRWLGRWSGWNPIEFVKTRFNSIEQMLFGNNVGQLFYWKDSSDTNATSTYLDNGQPIAEQTLRTKGFQFGEPVGNKAGYNAVLRFTGGEATLKCSAVMDLEETRTFQAAARASGDLLGVGILGQFLLASVRPLKVSQSLRGLREFNEMYLELTTDRGWFKLRNITMAAFPKAYDG